MVCMNQWLSQLILTLRREVAGGVMSFDVYFAEMEVIVAC